MKHTCLFLIILSNWYWFQNFIIFIVLMVKVKVTINAKVKKSEEMEVSSRA